ncbi:tigger transposable element-derived protein 6 [Plakobranchus ocellatus]|uniref:Tigger transposable element-derived protein 6 n=1 Tax=Plakobranchus ocellatus TaxID=259542 RepID=A0AAV4AMP4_9GAST|nr:tigger transposable element-derived protein 6 [Plakobranchus ocellatus]
MESHKESRDRLAAWIHGVQTRVDIAQREATSITRGSTFNRHNVTTFFRNLEEANRKIKVIPFNVYNLDETNMTTVHNPPQILAQRGSKQVGVDDFANPAKPITMKWAS